MIVQTLFMDEDKKYWEKTYFTVETSSEASYREVS